VAPVIASPGIMLGPPPGAPQAANSTAVSVVAIASLMALK